MTEDCLFSHLERMQGAVPWGSVLDAGTGEHSLEWVRGLETTRWTAVTCDPGLARRLQEELRHALRPGDRIVEGCWSDPLLLHGESFDVVLADYLLGAIEAWSPHFQDRLFARLRCHTAGRLYVVGLEPYPEEVDSPAGEVVLEIARLRDACILLAGHRPHREYPLEWCLRALERSGFAVDEAQTFPIVYGPRFIRSQLEVARSKLRYFRDPKLGRRMEGAIADLERRALAVSRSQGGLRFGEDYVIHARPR